MKKEINHKLFFQQGPNEVWEYLEHSAFKVMENLMILTAMDQGWLNNIHKISELINKRKNGTGS